MSGCLPTDAECKHGAIVNAVQNSFMQLGYSISFSETEILLCELYKEGYIIEERNETA